METETNIFHMVTAITFRNVKSSTVSTWIARDAARARAMLSKLKVSPYVELIAVIDAPIR